MAWGRGGLSNERERVFPVRLTDTKLPTTPCTHLCLSPFAMAVSPGRSTMRVAIVRLPRGELSSPVFVCRAPRPPTYGAGAVTAATHHAANHSSAANCGHPAELRVCFHCPPFGTSPSGRPATPPSHSPVCPPPPLQRPPPRHRRAAPPIGRCALSVAGVPPSFVHHRRHDQHTRKVAFAGWTAGRDARTADQPGRALPPAAQCSTGSATTMHLLSTTACTKRDQGGGGLVVVEGGGVVEEAP